MKTDLLYFSITHCISNDGMSSKVAILYVVPLIQPVFVTKFDMFAEKGYLHFMSAWWDTLGIVCRDISFWHLVQALFNNPKIKNKKQNIKWQPQWSSFRDIA